MDHDASLRNVARQIALDRHARFWEPERIADHLNWWGGAGTFTADDVEKLLAAERQDEERQR